MTTTRERALEAALIDATAMLRVYVAPSGRDGPNVTTRGQAIATIRDASAALALQPSPSALDTSAPDMLAALCEVLPHAAQRIQGTTEGEPILARARAAIARATGKEG